MDIAVKYFLEISREKTDIHRNLQVEFDEIKSNLENAKDEFDGLSNEHVVIMDNITTSYSEYLDTEFEYEKAYAVWEYADTAYIDVVYAIENYYTITEQYEESLYIHELAKEGAEKQQTVEKLNEVEEYSNIRKAFVDASDLFINNPVKENFENRMAALEQYLKHCETGILEGKYDRTVVLRDQVELYTKFYQDSRNTYVEFNENDYEPDPAKVQKLFDEKKDEIFAQIEEDNKKASEGTDVVDSETEDQSYKLSDEDKAQIEAAEKESIIKQLKKEAHDNQRMAFQRISSEFLSNYSQEGIDSSLAGQIVKSQMNQNIGFQQQIWTQQEKKFIEKYDRWETQLDHMMSAGEAEWDGNINTFQKEWKDWRIATVQKIEEGEEEYKQRIVETKAAIDKWKKDVMKAAVEEGNDKLLDELLGNISKYLEELNKRLPKKLKLDINVEARLKAMLLSAPVTGLGILEDAVNMVDTSAGFSEIFDLGLSSSFFKSYQGQMEGFSEKLEKMQAVRVGEVAYASMMEIITEFNENLAKANKSVYDMVNDDIRMSPTYKKDPFKRSNGQWSIRVVTDKTIIRGIERRTIRFNDYKYMENTTVFIKPLKGLEGEIDFNDPYSYENIDPNEIQIYADLSQQNINNAIDEVFKKGGSFEKHRTEQLDYLEKQFANAHKKYDEGEIIRKKAWYELDGMVIFMAIIGVACAIAAPFTSGATLAAYIAMETAMAMHKGYKEGGLAGMFMGLVSGAVTGVVQGYTVGAIQLDVGYSYEDGWGGSLSGGYKGARASIGYSEKKGFSAGVEFGYGGIGAGMSWNEKDGFGASLGLSSSYVDMGGTWSEKSGFGVSARAGYGGYGGATFGWSEKGGVTLGAYVGTGGSYAKGEKDKWGGSTTMGLDYSFKRRGFDVSVSQSARSSFGASKDWGSFGTSSRSAFSFSEKGKYLGSSTTSSYSFKFNPKYLYQKAYDDEKKGTAMANKLRHAQQSNWIDDLVDIAARNRKARQGQDPLDGQEKNPLQAVLPGLQSRRRRGSDNLLDDFFESLGNAFSGDGFMIDENVAINKMNEFFRDKVDDFKKGNLNNLSKEDTSTLLQYAAADGQRLMTKKEASRYLFADEYAKAVDGGKSEIQAQKVAQKAQQKYLNGQAGEIVDVNGFGYSEGVIAEGDKINEYHFKNNSDPGLYEHTADYLDKYGAFSGLNVGEVNVSIGIDKVETISQNSNYSDNNEVNQEFLENVNDVATDVVDDLDVQPGYPDDNDIANGVPKEPGQTSDTWCNRALYRMLTKLGVNNNSMLSNNPNTGEPDINYTTANNMATNLLESSSNQTSGVSLVDAETAQELANNGQAVVVAYNNSNGSGHVALVVPDNNTYDPNKGPHIAQAGGSNHPPSHNVHVDDTFHSGWENEVKYYVLNN